MSLRELTNFLILISIFNEIKTYLKFNIPSDYDKCFEKEVYSEGSILIKYDLTGYDKEFKNENEQKNLFKNIKIFIKNKKNKNIYETELKSRKEKLAVKLQGPDRFKICARYNKPYRGRELNKDILLALKLTSNYDYKELNVNLKKSDVSNFWEKIYSIKRDMRDSIEAAKSEINDEDSSAKSMISSINLYYKLCCIQLSVVVLLTIFNLWSYKDYFKKISLI